MTFQSSGGWVLSITLSVAVPHQDSPKMGLGGLSTGSQLAQEKASLNFKLKYRLF